MFTFQDPAFLLLALPLVALIVYVWRTGYANTSRRRGRFVLGVRLALSSAILLGLAGMGLSLPQQRQAVSFVADLSASDARDSDTIRSLINDALARRNSENRAAIVTVGRQALVE